MIIDGYKKRVFELNDGSWCGIEIKLGASQIEEAANNLLKFSNKCMKKPSFLCVISGMIDYAYQRKDGVYVLPITALKP